MNQAKNLSKEPPRSPRIRIGGYAILGRMIDKGRATVAGTPGEYHFNCPLDKMLTSFKGVDGENMRPLLAAGKSGGEILAWLNANGTPKTTAEIKAWADGVEALNYYNHPEKEKQEWFIGECKNVGIDPVTSTLFDYLEADDRVSFKK
jgi:hypothetical protein